MPRKKASVRNDFVHRDILRMDSMRSVLSVVFRSTGCANRLIPPSQCQRSCRRTSRMRKLLIPSSECSQFPSTCEACRRLRSTPTLGCRERRWWSRSGSNRRPQACKARALPTELWPRKSGDSRSHTLAFADPLVAARLVGPGRVERPTSRLSGVRSNHLSYEPDEVFSVRSGRQDRHARIGRCAG